MRPLVGIAGATLAEPLRARVALPGFDRSAMDGWVVSGAPPWRLLERIPIGSPPPREELPNGTARPISTGAPVPPGDIAVLRLEDGRIDGPLLSPVGGQAPEPGADIRRAGEEARPGDLLLPVGARLSPAALSLAAVAGADELTVRDTPAVDLLLLGDEIVLSGIPAEGLVRDAYGSALPALLRVMGAEVGSIARAPDRLEETVAALRASTAPLLVSTGGTSAGAGDQMRAALAELDCALVVAGVRMRPGSPTLLGLRDDGRPVLALPGNPFAALVALLVLGTPLLDGMLGRPLRDPVHLAAGRRFDNPRRSTLVAACRFGDAGLEPTAWQGSAMLRGLASADCLALVPPGGADPGDALPVLRLPG